jgi:hypothetical protein
MKKVNVGLIFIFQRFSLSDLLLFRENKTLSRNLWPFFCQSATPLGTRVSTEVTFWNSAEDGILCGSDLHSAEFRGIPRKFQPITSAKFRGIPFLFRIRNSVYRLQQNCY